MDALAALLDGPRARGAFLIRTSLAPPWALSIEDRAPLSVFAIVRGHAWFVPEEGEPTRLDAGDVGVVRRTDRYVVADAVDSPPIARILPDESCVSLTGQPLADTMSQGVRTWGNDPDGPDVMLVGTYAMDGEVTERLLAALPPALVVRAQDRHDPLLAVLAAEITRDDPGQTAVLDRLLDLLLIGTLRTWFSRPDSPAPTWWSAQGDPVVGPALRLLHHNPGEPWTVAALASEVGVSRALLARRFTELVGEPPMSYITTWRLELAADRLADPGTSLGAVAAEVGYATPFALSAAFKRVRGISPREHRRRLTLAS